MTDAISTDPTSHLIANEWLPYNRVGRLDARMYVDGEDLRHISLSPADNLRPSLVGGMIARNPDNHFDQWYIAPDYFAKHYRHAGPSPERMAETTARTGPAEPDNDLVICPNCTSQFRAIPVNVQAAINLERQRLVSLADRWSKKGRWDEADEVYARINAIDLAMNAVGAEKSGEKP